MTDLHKLIRDIPDFPKPGILFKDITPLLKDPAGFKECTRLLCDIIGGVECDAIVGIESRGFLFGAAAALELGIGFVPIRKPGKLPYKTCSVTYDLEYGTDTVEMHVDAVSADDKVLMVDDLLATGGTMAAACQMVAEAGAEIVGIAFLIELAFLNGRGKLPDCDITSKIVVD